MATPRSNARHRRGDIAQAALALACLAAVIAFSLLVDSKDQGAMRESSAAHEPTDEDIYTGSILFMPYNGNMCRQNMLDNRTGSIKEIGTVPCDVALSRLNAAQARAWSAARVDAIRDGFAKR
ncbi:MAG TPA: hypothetical protein VHA55_06140 [Pseudorhodoplanes sp.]|jgi:hypothetical protein|nr:hypothetical protein [Pseudorhodoplanes sp.]